MADCPKISPKKDGRGKAPKSVKGGYPNWDKATCSIMQARSVKSRYDRKKAREEEFEAYKQLGMADRIKKAFDEKDKEMLDMCLKFSAHVGTDYRASSDFVQRQQVEGDIDAKVQIRVIKDEPKNEKQLG